MARHSRRQELGAWQPERAVPFERLRNGSAAGPDQWVLRLPAWQTAHAHFKLVEWDPAARAVVAWEKGADRQLFLGEDGTARFEPRDTRVRL